MGTESQAWMGSLAAPRCPEGPPPVESEQCQRQVTTVCYPRVRKEWEMWARSRHRTAHGEVHCHLRPLQPRPILHLSRPLCDVVHCRGVSRLACRGP